MARLAAGIGSLLLAHLAAVAVATAPVPLPRPSPQPAPVAVRPAFPVPPIRLPLECEPGAVCMYDDARPRYDAPGTDHEELQVIR
jgi:hypothetical protein